MNSRRYSYVVILELANVFVVLVDVLAVAGHLALPPQANILAARFGVEISALAVSEVLLPLALVAMVVGVRVHAVALSHIVHPVALVLRAVQVDEHTLAVLLVLDILANVAAAVFKSRKIRPIDMCDTFIEVKISFYKAYL
jgi:hypothetical protein